jgi:hypothetical protein
MVELCLHSAISFDGMVLKYLSTGTNIAFHLAGEQEHMPTEAH